MSSNRDIQIEFDEETQNYYVSWEPPIAIGLGKTKEEALEDLREAAHLARCGYPDRFKAEGRQMGFQRWCKNEDN